jgi:hypothetical protein
VLKKAGIVVAAAAAGLLAVSPLAFAGDKDDDHDHDRDYDGKKKVKVEKVKHHDDSDKDKAFIYVADNNVAVNSCDNREFEFIYDAVGALAIWGDARTDTSDVNVCAQDANAGVER